MKLYQKFDIKYLLLIPLLIILYNSTLRMDSYFDDVLIYARYIRNFLKGNGLVYNVGEKFNGMTSPLFAYLATALSYITKNIILSLNLLSAIFFVLSIVVFYKIAKLFDFGVSFTFASIIYALFPFSYSVFGMETYLYLFLIGLCTLLFLKENYKYLPTIAALLLLTRTEGIFLLLPMIIEHFRLRRKFPKLEYFIVPSFILLLNYSFNYFYFESFSPHSAQAKVKHGISGIFGDRKGLLSYIVTIIPFRGISNLLFIMLIILGIFKLKFSSLNFLLLTFNCLFLGFLFYFNIPPYHWYFVPLFFILILYMGAGLSLILSIQYSTIKLVGVMILFSLIVFSFKKSYYGNSTKKGRGQDYKPIGEWLNKNTPKNSKVALVEIGIIGYFSDRYIVDYCGLISPNNADYILKKDYNSWILTGNPDYVLTHKPFWTYEKVINEDFFKKRYILLKEFDYNKQYQLYQRKK